MLAANKQRLLPILPENWFCVRVFDAMASQWRLLPAANGGVRFIGLDYAALPVVLAALRRTQQHPQPLHVLLPQLQVMEGAAMAVLNNPR